MLKKSIVLTLSLLLATPALADKVLTVEPVSPEAALRLGIVLDDDCPAGNPNGVYFGIPDWIWGNESYTYIFDPLETCGCAAGFEISDIHMIVQFGPEDVPATFEAFVEIGAPIWDDAASCWIPGPVSCTTPVTELTVDCAGLYDIVLPIDDCGCMEMSHQYSISYNFVTAFDSNPDIVTDQYPTTCTSWNDYGLGWYDLVGDFGYPGNILMWADAGCCQDPVANEDRTWGGVKALYR